MATEEMQQKSAEWRRDHLGKNAGCSEEIDHHLTDEIVCPHCGHKEDDSWDRGEGETIGDVECDECGETFYALRVITIDYTTSKTNDF